MGRHFVGVGGFHAHLHTHTHIHKILYILHILEAYLLKEQRAMEQGISMGRNSKWPTGSKEASSRKRTALDSSAVDLWVGGWIYIILLIEYVYVYACIYVCEWVGGHGGVVSSRKRTALDSSICLIG